MLLLSATPELDVTGCHIKSTFCCMSQSFFFFFFIIFFFCVTPWTAAHQAPLSTGFSRQEYWSGVPFPSPACHNLIEKWFVVVAQNKRRRHSKRTTFLICGQLTRHLLIETFQLSNSFQMPNDNRMVSTELCGNFLKHVVVRGSALIILSIGRCQLPTAGHYVHLQGSQLLCKT